MKNLKSTPPWTQTDIAKMADAAGIALSGQRVGHVTDLANRFRGSVGIVRDYLLKQDTRAGKAGKG